MERLKFAEFEFLKKEKIFHYKWLANTEDAEEDEMKTAFISYIDQLKICLPQSIIIDERELKFIFDPAFQQWIAENVNEPTTSVGVKKVAFIQSRDFIINLVDEQFFEDNSRLAVQIRFFESFEDAYNWVLNRGKKPELAKNN